MNALNNGKCLICGSQLGLQRHHIFGGTANRKISQKHGLCVYLCAMHHTGSCGVHIDRALDLEVKAYGQRYYEANIGSRSDFIKEFGKSWL